jgi:hypothetical protein
MDVNMKCTLEKRTNENKHKKVAAVALTRKYKDKRGHPTLLSSLKLLLLAPQSAYLQYFWAATHLVVVGDSI